MKTFFIRFDGRTKGAIGIFTPCRLVLEADSADAALLKLYDTHEPLHVNVAMLQECPIRYVVTHVRRDGLRVLSHAAQGRNTYDTAEDAQAWIDAAKVSNSADTLRSVYGDVALMEVRPVACWPRHYDPMRTIFD